MSSSGSLSLKQNFDPTRTYGTPTPTTGTTTTETASSIAPDLYARVAGVSATTQPGGEDAAGSSKTIWDRINSPSIQRAVRGNTSPIVPVHAGGILQPTMVSKWFCRCAED